MWSLTENHTYKNYLRYIFECFLFWIFRVHSRLPILKVLFFLFRLFVCLFLCLNGCVSVWLYACWSLFRFVFLWLFYHFIGSLSLFFITTATWYSVKRLLFTDTFPSEWQCSLKKKYENQWTHEGANNYYVFIKYLVQYNCTNIMHFYC